ncbi:MAG: LysM peptidoglycan-binding domain-containing protein, partial [Dehalococcoidales bacterium]|nr:LysM peptidoglycan-binding domain-containing protein [Dehalococcoidales bacterium]
MRPIEEAPERQGYLGLLGLILGLAIGGVALYVVAGPPQLPRELPGWDIAASTLRGSYLPLEAVAYVLTTAAWAVWLWIVASLAFRLVVLAAEAATGGAPWVAGLHAISDRVTPAVVRRVVDGALVAIIVVNLVGRSTPTAAAAVLSMVAATTVVATYESAPPQPDSEEALQGQSQQVVEYTVQAGDTLWGIAERFYGTGHEYPMLLADNVGRRMPDGRRFTQAGVIQPGWVLLVHPASRAMEEVNGQSFYTVQEGDTLRGIAARLLDDESRWQEIFDLNAGTARLEDGRTLKDPGLIWPGLRLRLPSSAPTSDGELPVSEPAAPAAEETSATPETAAIVETQPTAMPADPEGVVVVDEPSVAPMPAVLVEPEPAPAEVTVSPLVYGAAGLAAIAAAGGAVALARRRVRRSLSELPVRAATQASSPPSGDFAEAEFGRVLTHRIHGKEVEPVVLVAEQALRFLEEHRVPDASVVMAQQGRNATTLVLSVGLLDQARVLELAGELGMRLGGTGQASSTPDHDVAFHLSGLKLAGLVTLPSRGPARTVPLLPVGVLPRGQTLYANWRELGHILVAGLPGGGTEIVLTSLISALAASPRAEELRLWTVADRRLLPPELLQLPHQCGTLVDPADEAGVSHVLQQVRAELIRRMRVSESEGSLERASRPEEPELVLAIGGLGNLRDDGTTLELIGVHGPTHGVRLLATTTSPAELPVDLLAHFATRLVLQTLDDDESIRLLGQPEAADLGTGDLLLRVDGRLPVRARGLRVSPDRLDELVQLIREAYGGQAPVLELMEAEPDKAEGGCHPAADGESGTAAGQLPIVAEEPEGQFSELEVEAGEPGAHEASGEAGEPAQPVERVSESETVDQSPGSVADVAVGEDQSNGHHAQEDLEPLAQTANP